MSTHKNTYEIFGKRLSETMKEREVTQSVLARAVGVVQSAISNYCQGKRLPPIEETLKIAEFLKVDVRWLLAWKENTAQLREKLQSIHNAVESLPVSEDEKTALFHRLAGDPIRFDLDDIRKDALSLVKKIESLQERMLKKPKPTK